MMSPAGSKYRPYPALTLKDRRWPDAVITRAPVWCSVDLRDGNQALIDPMDPERKMRLWNTLLGMGFKEIEVGFPAASQTDFDFIRVLIEGGHIPSDVTIQILTQAREDLIRRSFEAIRGAKNVIVHLYNSTSEVQRRVVFGFDRQGCVDLALTGTRLVRALSAARPEGEVAFQYSPESFTGTEPDFAVTIVEAVAEAWQASPTRKMIVNLPATVEMSTPNLYADVIEWFSRAVRDRESLILSVHPHNDRGTGVAAAELALMAGADRVEGTLFGNGERTGNVDGCTLALNLYTQGVDPALDLSDIDTIRRVAEDCTRLPIHPRHPYAGELVYTAFSGSHQDAIKKGLTARNKGNDPLWEVPYLPIDPADVGRTYEAVIRINSQSGKGGVAYVLERDHGLCLPKPMQAEFAKIVQAHADRQGRELSAEEIYGFFAQTYLTPGWLSVNDYSTVSVERGLRALTASVTVRGGQRTLTGSGTGPVDAFVHALKKDLGLAVEVVDYHEHAIGGGSDASAACYVAVKGEGDEWIHGVARDPNVTMAAVLALVAAVNRRYGA